MSLFLKDENIRQFKLLNRKYNQTIQNLEFPEFMPCLTLTLQLSSMSLIFINCYNLILKGLLWSRKWHIPYFN